MTHYCNSSYSENEFSLVNNLPEREDEWAWVGGKNGVDGLLDSCTTNCTSLPRWDQVNPSHPLLCRKRG